jgi:ferrous iron transport protein A
MPESLDTLTSTEIRQIAGFGPLPEHLRARLLELGLDEGVEVERIAAGPIGGDPIAVRVGRTVIALRRALARSVLLAPSGRA